MDLGIKWSISYPYSIYVSFSFLESFISCTEIKSLHFISHSKLQICKTTNITQNLQGLRFPTEVGH